MEFQKKLEKFKSQGINIVGVSDDAVEILQKFSQKQNITYPLLSDPNSKIIKAYGILNTDLDPAHKWYGIPYPGIFIVNRNLVVTAKQFEQAYYQRPTARSVLINFFGEQIQSNAKKIDLLYLFAVIGVSDSVAHAAQLVTVAVEISMKNGFHLYGTPLPTGYIPLSISVAPNPNFDMDAFQYPPGKKLEIKSLNETFTILPEKVTLKSFLRIKKNPRKGSQTISITMAFQACDDTSCMQPESVLSKFPLDIQ